MAASELFGHERGAFTDAKLRRKGLVLSANGGTLFLDEIGRAGRPLQQRLLGLFEQNTIRPVGSDTEIPIDVRIISATSLDLETLASKDQFLPDLLHRVVPFRVRMPALRERAEDIPVLARYFVRRHARKFAYDSNPPALHADLVATLEAAPWEGNLRQLDNVIQQLLLEASPAPVLTLMHCRNSLAYLRSQRVSATPRTTATREVVVSTIEKLGSQVKAAKELGIARSTLRRHLFRSQDENSTSD